MKRALLVLVVATMACSSPPMAPDPPDNNPPPLGDPPMMTCPASQTIQSPDGNGVVVNYTPPQVTGGLAPVTTPFCEPATGTLFSPGTTNVECTARDAAIRTTSCSFSVTVVPPPFLSDASFVAFGDSITAGVLPSCPIGFTALDFTDRPTLAFWDDIARLRALVNVETSYPTQLENQLKARYTAQTPTVKNEGEAGEKVTDASTATRLTTVLDLHNPLVLLLQEGANDVHSKSTSNTTIANAITGLVRQGKDRGLHVFLGTLLPERAGACRAFAPDRIGPMNTLIRGIAEAEDVELVDLHAAFVGQEATLLSEDGLHPSIEGYAKIADVFFEAIRETLEVQVTPTLTSVAGTSPAASRSFRPGRRPGSWTIRGSPR